MKARVHVYFRESIFDPQGNTVADSLRRLGFSQVQDVRIGKVIDIVLETAVIEEARREVAQMCEKLLVNPVIESYRVEYLEK